MEIYRKIHTKMLTVIISRNEIKGRIVRYLSLYSFRKEERMGEKEEKGDEIVNDFFGVFLCPDFQTNEYVLFLLEKNKNKI